LKTGANTQHKQIYIVVSQTGTILSRILKRITGAEYNHASISFSPDLLTMYSFGRMHPYNPVWGGLVKESPNSGTFKRFSGTRVVVLSITVSQEKYLKMLGMVSAMYEHRKKYHYNYLGLLFAGLSINLRVKRSYYCSEFVYDVLTTANVKGVNRLSLITHPADFLQLPGAHVVYRGKLCEYSYSSVF